MNPIADQQVVLDNALVTPENRICPRLPNQEFDAPPSDEEIVTFIKNLGTKVTLNLSQMWLLIKCTNHGEPLLQSSTSVYLGKLLVLIRSDSQVTNTYSIGTSISWPTIDNKDHKKQEKIYYPRFTKVIIHHFISKDTSIFMRNKICMHTVRDDSVLDAGLSCLQDLSCIRYRSCKFKKPASPSKKKTLVVVEEPAGNLPRNLLLEDSPLGFKSETLLGADLESKVPDEPKDKSIDTSEGTGLKPRVTDVSKADSSETAIKTDDEEKDEFVHTPDDFVPTDDENINDEEFERINKEMYSDVNVELKDSECEGKGKDDEEITDAEHKNVSQEVAGDQVKGDAQATVIVASTTQKTEVPLQSSSISSDYAIKFLNFDNIPLAPVTTIPPPIPPFITLPQQSTPIPTPTTKEATTSTTTATDSSTLTTIHQRLFDIENEVKTLRNVDHSSTIRAAVKFKVPIIVKEYLGTSLDDALHKVLQRHTVKLVKEHSVLADVTDVLQQQPKPQKSAADIRKIKMEQAGKQQEPKYTIVSSDVDALWEFDQKRTLFETMTKTKSFERNSKHKALYHALMESILEDKYAMDKGVADKHHQVLAKSTSKSAQAEEIVFEAKDTQVPHDLGEDMGNTDEPPVVKADPKDWFKKPERPPTLDPEWNECKIVDNKLTQKWLSNLAKADTSSKTFDDLMSTPIDFNAFVMNRLQIIDLTQDIQVGLAYKLLKGTCRSYVKLDYNMEECYKALNDQLDWNNLEGDRYPIDLSKPLPLNQSRNCQVVLVDYFFNNDLAYLQGESTGRTYTTSLTKTKAAKYDLPGIEDMVPKL
ncbi:hypothetical protein Tco_0914642 [Tanacetum coccineum]